MATPAADAPPLASTRFTAEDLGRLTSLLEGLRVPPGEIIREIDAVCWLHGERSPLHPTPPTRRESDASLRRLSAAIDEFFSAQRALRGEDLYRLMARWSSQTTHLPWGAIPWLHGVCSKGELTEEETRAIMEKREERGGKDDPVRRVLLSHVELLALGRCAREAVSNDGGDERGIEVAIPTVAGGRTMDRLDVRAAGRKARPGPVWVAAEVADLVRTAKGTSRRRVSTERVVQIAEGAAFPDSRGRVRDVASLLRRGASAKLGSLGGDWIPAAVRARHAWDLAPDHAPATCPLCVEPTLEGRFQALLLACREPSSSTR